MSKTYGIKEYRPDGGKNIICEGGMSYERAMEELLLLADYGDYPEGTQLGLLVNEEKEKVDT